MANVDRLRVLVTGGAGFVGGNVACALAQRRPQWTIVAFDNLRRRGAELNINRLREAGVSFVHGDVRAPADLQELAPIDALVECSAEPSVLAGLDGDTQYPVHTNLFGAYNCLELARRDGAQFAFLSTSRIYPIASLNAIRYSEEETRLEILAEQDLPGISRAGVSERFPLEGARTLYGATKLGAELLVAEYAAVFGLRTVVNRCGVIAGPWQMGKVDQGVFTYWLLSHYLGRELSYIGFGGTGKQVRDLLHVNDLVDLLEEQLVRPEPWSGVVANVGGGSAFSLSLVETTALCQELTGRRVAIRAVPETRPGDVPVYVSDCGALFEHTEWRPRRDPRQVLEDTLEWIVAHERSLVAALA